MIKLKADCGAVDNEPVEPALLKALDLVANGEAGKIIIDGKFRLTKTIHYSFLNKPRQHLIIEGEGAHSQLIPDFPGNGRALSFHNLESLVLRDFVFCGDKTKPYPSVYDCGAIMVLGTINQVVWDNVHVYGICSPKENLLGLFWIENCGFEQRSSQIRGTTAVNSAVFSFKNPKRTHIRGPEVLDYGMMDGWYAARTSIGFTDAWYRFIAPYPTNVYRSVPVFEHVSLDEGALYGIRCDEGDGWMRGIRLSDVSINVRVAGLKLNRVHHAVLEDCYSTYREEKPVCLVDGVDVKSTRLIRCEGDKQARTVKLRRSDKRVIDATDPRDKLLLDECDGLIVDAPSTAITVLPAKPSRFSWLSGG